MKPRRLKNGNLVVPVFEAGGMLDGGKDVISIGLEVLAPTDPKFAIWDKYANAALTSPEAPGSTETATPTSTPTSDTSVAPEPSGDVTGASEPTTKAKDPTVGGGVDRSKLKPSDYVFADELKFPIVKPIDVRHAVNSWGRYKGKKSFEAFKRNLIALARKKGESFVEALPDAWDVES